MFGFEPYNKIRLGKELSQLVRFYGIGGIFHSDELPGYGISKENIDSIEKKLAMSSKDDAFIIIGGRLANVTSAIESLIQRLKVVLDGVPAETRAAITFSLISYVKRFRGLLKSTQMSCFPTLD